MKEANVMGTKMFKLWSVLILMGFFAGSAIGDDSGLVAHWPFDGNAADVSGNGNDGVAENDQYVEGVLGQALQCDGLTKVTVPGSVWENAITNTVSVVLWYYAPEKGSGYDHVFVAAGDQTMERQYAIWFSTARYWSFISAIGNKNTQANQIKYTISPDLVTGGWHQWCQVTNYAGNQHFNKLYLDGMEVATGSNIRNVGFQPVQEIVIGEGVTGFIDDVRIYNTVLTGEDLINMMPRDDYATYPNPEDEARTVDKEGLILSWVAGYQSVNHNIYFGTSADLGPDDLIADQAEASYTLTESLEPGTVYYWRVDETTADGILTEGPVWSFETLFIQPYNPIPDDQSALAPAQPNLSWLPSDYESASVNVYLSTDRVLVDSNSAEALAVSLDGSATSYRPYELITETGTTIVPLEHNQTYYWRVVEVDFDGFTYAGEVWSFTVMSEIDIVDPNLVGWWKFDEGQGKVAVDSSGYDHHGYIYGVNEQWSDGVDGTCLRLGLAHDHSIAAYVETEFQGLASPNEVTVAAWVQTYTDGAGEILTWSNFRFNYVFGRPRTQKPDASTTVNSLRFQGDEWHHFAAAINSEQGVTLYCDGQAHPNPEAAVSLSINPNKPLLIGGRNGAPAFDGRLDDVRVYDVALTRDQILDVMRVNPQQAWNPAPIAGLAHSPDDLVELSWNPGVGAVSHIVYLSEDRAAVVNSDPAALLATTDTHSVSLGDDSLTLSQHVRWRVDEVQADGSVVEGMIWEFKTGGSLEVDRFDSYVYDEDDGQDLEIWFTWSDGFGGNGTGSTLEYPVTAGTMLMLYDNTTLFYSEVSREFDEPQNLTCYGCNQLQVRVKGNLENNPAPFYVVIEDSTGQSATVTFPAEATINSVANDYQSIDLYGQIASEGVDITSVKKLILGIGDKSATEPGGTGSVEIDNIIINYNEHLQQ